VAGDVTRAPAPSRFGTNRCAQRTHRRGVRHRLFHPPPGAPTLIPRRAPGCLAGEVTTRSPGSHLWGLSPGKTSCGRLVPRPSEQSMRWVASHQTPPAGAIGEGRVTRPWLGSRLATRPINPPGPHRVAWADSLRPDRGRAQLLAQNPQAPARSQAGGEFVGNWPVAGQAACAAAVCPAPDGLDGSGSPDPFFFFFYFGPPDCSHFALGRTEARTACSVGARASLSNSPLAQPTANKASTSSPQARSGAPLGLEAWQTPYGHVRSGRRRLKRRGVEKPCSSRL